MTKGKKSARIAWDVLISGLFILMGASGCYAFFHYRDQLDQLISGIPVGELHPSNPSGVRLRANNSMIWQDVGKVQSVSLGDAVFTGHSATTKVVLKNRIETELASDSLVVFNPPSDEIRAKFPDSFAVLSVQKGSVKLNVAHGGEALLIQANGKLFSMPAKQGMIDLHVDETTGRIEAKSEQGERFALKEESVNFSQISKPVVDIPVEHAGVVTPVEKPAAEARTEAVPEVLPTALVPPVSALAVRGLASEKPAIVKPINPFADPAAPAAVNRVPNAVATEIPAVVDSEIFTPKVGYGVGFVNFSQRGALGSGSGSALSANLIKAGLDFQSGDFGACVEFSRYALDFQTDSSTGTTMSSKSFQNIVLQGTYQNFHAGVHASTSPLLAEISATDVRFLDFTTLSIMAGYKLEKDWLSTSGKALQTSLDFTAELPVSGSSSVLDGTVKINHVSGFGAKVTGKIAKALTPVRPDSNIQFLIGIEASGGFTRTELNSNVLKLQGDSTRDLQEYQALLQLRMNF